MRGRWRGAGGLVRWKIADRQRKNGNLPRLAQQQATPGGCRVWRRSLGRGFFSRCPGDPAEAHLAQRPFAARGGGRYCGKDRVCHHHHAHLGEKMPRPGDVPVVGAPEHLQAAVDALDDRAALVHQLELPGRLRQRRKATQVDPPRHGDSQSVGLARFTRLRHRTGPVFVPGGAGRRNTPPDTTAKKRHRPRGSPAHASSPPKTRQDVPHNATGFGERGWRCKTGGQPI